MPSFTAMKRRLRFLRDLESLNVFLLPATLILIWFLVDQPVDWRLRLSTLSLVVYILVQGSFYWHLKLRSLTDRKGFPGYFAPLFRFFRRSNLAAIVGVSLLIVFAIFRGHAARADVIWSTGLAFLAVLEHVNYYAYQLTHDTTNDLAYLWRHRRLRRAALAEDLARWAHPKSTA